MDALAARHAGDARRGCGVIRDLARDVLAGVMPWWVFIPLACGVILLVLNVYEVIRLTGEARELDRERARRRAERIRRRERPRLDEARAHAALYPRDHALDVLPLNVTRPENTSAPAAGNGRGA